MESDRKVRRQAAIVRNLKKQERLEKAREALPPEAKRRKVPVYGRSSIKYLMDSTGGDLKSSVRRRRARRRPYRSSSSSLPPFEGIEADNDVLFLSHVDYASVGYMFTESLKAVGLKAASLANRQFVLRSDSEQSTVCSGSSIIEAVRRSKVVVWMHSYYQPVPDDILRSKKTVVFHGGTRYRRSPRRMNARFNKMVDLSLIQTGELLDRGAKNQRWILPPVDIEKIQPNYGFEKEDKLVVGHFTSHTGNSSSKAIHVKGTPIIRNVINSLKISYGDKFEFRSSDQLRVPWNENLRRMGKCDIYIESLAHGDEENKNKHDWSVTALESSALGCITITNFLFEERYLEEYGEHALVVANTKNQLKAALIDLLNKDRDELLEMKKKARAWVEEKHSYKAIGERLRGVLEI